MSRAEWPAGRLMAAANAAGRRRMRPLMPVMGTAPASRNDVMHRGQPTDAAAVGNDTATISDQ